MLVRSGQVRELLGWFCSFFKIQEGTSVFLQFRFVVQPKLGSKFRLGFISIMQQLITRTGTSDSKTGAKLWSKLGPLYTRTQGQCSTQIKQFLLVQKLKSAPRALHLEPVFLLLVNFAKFQPQKYDFDLYKRFFIGKKNDPNLPDFFMLSST